MNKLIIPAIIIFAAFTRLMPHPPNFTPIIAMGLFGGAYLKDKRLALLLPMGAMLIADIFLGFHGTMLVFLIVFLNSESNRRTFSSLAKKNFFPYEE